MSSFCSDVDNSIALLNIIVAGRLSSIRAEYCK